MVPRKMRKPFSMSDSRQYSLSAWYVLRSLHTARGAAGSQRTRKQPRAPAATQQAKAVPLGLELRRPAPESDELHIEPGPLHVADEWQAAADRVRLARAQHLAHRRVEGGVRSAVERASDAREDLHETRRGQP